MYKAVVEFSASWIMSAVWAFLQEHSRGAWLQDILAQTAELGAYANEHDVHGLCLGLLSAALSERPAAADLKRWAEIHFGDEATWYGESDYKKALQARVQDEDTHDGSDGAVAASPSLSFRFKSPHDGPFAETAQFRKNIDDYVKRFVAGTVEVNLECTPDVDAEYLEQSGVTKLLECVLQSVRCFHPPEPLEAFVAYQLRMGLTWQTKTSDTEPDTSDTELAKVTTPAEPRATDTADKNAEAAVEDSPAVADGEKADDADEITEGLPVPAWAAAIPFRSHRQFTSYMLEREAAWRSQYEQLCNKPVSMNAKDFVSESPMDLCGSPVGMGLSLFHCACLVGRTEVVKECLLGSKLDPNLLAYVAAFSLDAVHEAKVMLDLMRTHCLQLLALIWQLQPIMAMFAQSCYQVELSSAEPCTLQLAMAQCKQRLQSSHHFERARTTWFCDTHEWSHGSVFPVGIIYFGQPRRSHAIAVGERR